MASVLVSGLVLLAFSMPAYADPPFNNDGRLFQVDWPNDVGAGYQIDVRTIAGPSEVSVAGWDGAARRWTPVSEFGLSVLLNPPVLNATVANARGIELAPDRAALGELDRYTLFRHFRIRVERGSPIRLVRQPCAECQAGGIQVLTLAPPPPIVVSTSHSGLGGTTGALAYDTKTTTYFRSSYDNWQWIRVDFGEVVEIAGFRRYMSRDGVNIQGNRGAQGEQVWTQGRSTDPLLVVPAAQTTGWSAYVNYNPNAWHSVVYGWSSWLNFVTPKRARYFQFQWDGNADALNELQITYTRFANTPPTITSLPPYFGRVGLQVSYQLQATDPNPGESFAYFIPQNPGGATISPTGLFTWTPQVQHAGGPHRFTVRVADSWEGIAEQSFEIPVAYVEPGVYTQLAAQGFAGVWIEPLPVFPTSSGLGFAKLLNWQKAEEDAAYSRMLGSLTSVAGVNGVRFYMTTNAVSATINNTGLAALQENRWVGRVRSIDVYEAHLYDSVPYIGAPPVYPQVGQGTGGAVAIIDTGVMAAHPFFTGRVRPGACFAAARASSSPCPGDSVAAGAGEPCPYSECSHGTHVAGIAAGFQSPSFNGVAPGANIVPLMAMSQFNTAADCQGNAPCGRFGPDALQRALEHAVRVGAEQNIKAVNMSLGSQAFSAVDCPDSNLRKPISLARRRGIAVVASSGNGAAMSGYTGGIGDPACQGGVTSVGATHYNSDSLYSGSQYSSELDLLAPGEGIVSSVPGGGYSSKTGTSMAAPHVSGAFVLLATHFPGLESANIEAALKYMGQPVFDARAGLTFPRLQFHNPVETPLLELNAPKTVLLDGRASRNAVTLQFRDDSAVEDRYELAARLNGILQFNFAPAAAAVDTVDDRSTGRIDTLQPGTTYEGFVRACKGAVCSAWSEPAAFTTEALNPPTGSSDYFRADQIASTSFRLVWRKAVAGNTTQFRVLIRGPQLESVLTVPWTSSEQTIVRSNLLIDRQYSAFLFLCNADGCSNGEFIPIHTSNAGESPPVITNVTRASDHEWDVTWDYVPGPTMPPILAFELDSTLPAVGALVWSTTQVSPTSRTIHVTRPTAPPSIAFRVRACRAAGCTDHSNIARP